MVTRAHGALLFVALLPACSSAGTPADAIAPVVSETERERVRYHVDEIAAPEGYGATTPGSINAAGVVVGSLDGRIDTSFVHRRGATRRLNVFDRVSEASGINARGDLVGTHMQSGRLDTFRPFQWLHGASHPVDLMNVLPANAVDAVGRDINDGRVVVGTFEVEAAGLKPHPFAYDNASGGVAVLHPPGATYAYATAINARNQIVGHLWDVDGEGFVYDLASGDYVPLGFEPAAINDRGLVVGNRDAETPITKQIGGQERQLPTFGAGSCRALAVNNTGVIVGTASRSASPAGEDVVAVSFEGGNIVDLNQRLVAGRRWHVVAAYDINDAGVIVGLAFRLDDRGRHLRGVRLTPT